ncbi:MAG: hypothetical protein RIQ46_581 [Pseudomonadota bacterium]
MDSASLSRREALVALGAGAAALALPGCAARTAPPATAAGPGIAARLDAMAERLLALSPESATSLGLDTRARAALRRLLADRSPAGIAAVAATLKADLAEAQSLDAGGLDAATATSLAVVKSAYALALDGLALPYGDVAVGGWRNTPYVVIQNVGAYIDVPRFLDADHPVRNAEDAEGYLFRLAAMGAQLDGELDRIRAARAMGLVPPAFLLDKALAQMDRTLADARDGGALVQSLASRTRNIAGDWQGRAAAIVRNTVIPALERQRAELAIQRGMATMDAGLSARPHGDAFYAWSLRASTTTRQTPREIHERGLEELASIHARMEPLLRGLGFASGTVGERMTAMGADPRFHFAEGDAGRAEIIATMQGRIDYIRTQLPRAFRRLAPGRLEIRRLPPAEEAGAPRAYGGPGSIDGTIPGKIWLNLGDTSRHSRFSAATLAFHEGIPGHVWQGEYAIRLPLIRSLLSFNAYSEGWALYAEQLGDELGAYDDDPAGRVGFLQNLAWRAARMVADTGIHAMGWSREKAAGWFITATGLPAAEVAAEIDRYCSWPGQACGYKLGHSEILAQRDMARRALGPKFDLRDFNQAVVDGGNVPLDVLADNVTRYVEAARR